MIRISLWTTTRDPIEIIEGANWSLRGVSSCFFSIFLGSLFLLSFVSPCHFVLPVSVTVLPVSDPGALWVWANQINSISVEIWLLFIFTPLLSITYSIWSQCHSLVNVLRQWDLKGVLCDGEKQGHSFCVWWYCRSILLDFCCLSGKLATFVKRIKETFGVSFKEELFHK